MNIIWERTRVSTSGVFLSSVLADLSGAEICTEECAFFPVGKVPVT